MLFTLLILSVLFTLLTVYYLLCLYSPYFLLMLFICLLFCAGSDAVSLFMYYLLPFLSLRTAYNLLSEIRLNMEVSGEIPVQ